MIISSLYTINVNWFVTASTRNKQLARHANGFVGTRGDIPKLNMVYHGDGGLVKNHLLTDPQCKVLIAIVCYPHCPLGIWHALPCILPVWCQNSCINGGHYGRTWLYYM